MSEVHDHLTAAELKPSFIFDGERIPLSQAGRGVWCDYQGKYIVRFSRATNDRLPLQDAGAADNRWFRKANIVFDKPEN